MDVDRKDQVLLPENDPIAREDQQEEYKPKISKDCQEIASNLGKRCDLFFPYAARFSEKDKHPDEHHEHTKRGESKDILYTHPRMNPSREEWAKEAADVDQGVVDRVSD